MKSERKKILITGGHVTTALAVIEELLKEPAGSWDILFAGRKFAMEGDREVSEEYKLIQGQNIRFLPLTMGRIQRSLTPTTLLSLLKIPVGFVQAYLICMKEKPDLICSFGGYIALPVVLAGYTLGIPSVTHEQTRIPGLTNRVIARYVKKVFISYPETHKAFSKNKTLYTGIPLRHALFTPPKIPSFSFDKSLPILYITGGSTGAKSMNDLLFPALKDLIRKFSIVHQTGVISFNDAVRIKHTLPADMIGRYIPCRYVGAGDVSWLMHNADMVIGRSGANTVAELRASGQVSILIPLPWAAGNEQYHNAKLLEEAGSAQILTQTEITRESLIAAADAMMRNHDEYKKNAVVYGEKFPRQGAHYIAAEIKKLMTVKSAQPAPMK